MTNDIESLQADISDHRIPVTTLLQRALVLATKSGDQDFVSWAKRELNGYDREDEDAKHRSLKGGYVVLTADGRSVPIHWESSVSGMNRRFITLPLSEIESLMGPGGDTFVVKVEIDPRSLTSLHLEPGDCVGFQHGRATVAGLLDAVRNRILDWTLGLAARRTPGGVLPDSPLADQLKTGVSNQDQGLVTPDIESAVLRFLKDQYVRNPSQRPAKVCPEIKQIMEIFGLSKTQCYELAARLESRGVVEWVAKQAEGEFLRIHPSIVRAVEILDLLASEAHKEAEREMGTPSIDPRKVFVVHGRNYAARDALFAFLRAVGLHPLEWTEVVKATGEASPYIGEVLQTGFSVVQAVVVLMTPDDEARLRAPYRGPQEPPDETELTPQPRPNVLLETGMALGLFPERTVIVELGRLRQVSDLLGRHTVRMDDSPEKRQELAQRLETAGCEVNRSGTDWYKAGQFVATVRD